MANSRCESHHRNGITDPECLQQTFTNKIGTSRHFAATQQLGRFWSEADIQRTALTNLNL
jgi:hypothetical protein